MSRWYTNEFYVIARETPSGLIELKVHYSDGWDTRFSICEKWGTANEAQKSLDDMIDKEGGYIYKLTRIEEE